MTTQYTPGPWTALSNVCVTVGSPGKGALATLRETDTQGGLTLTREIAMANARLIAAAPELLDAVKWLLTHDLLNDVDMPDDLRKDIDVLGRVIAKAEGK